MDKHDYQMAEWRFVNTVVSAVMSRTDTEATGLTQLLKGCRDAFRECWDEPTPVVPPPMAVPQPIPPAPLTRSNAAAYAWGGEAYWKSEHPEAPGPNLADLGALANGELPHWWGEKFRVGAKDKQATDMPGKPMREMTWGEFAQCPKDGAFGSAYGMLQWVANFPLVDNRGMSNREKIERARTVLVYVEEIRGREAAAPVVEETPF